MNLYNLPVTYIYIYIYFFFFFFFIIIILFFLLLFFYYYYFIFFCVPLMEWCYLQVLLSYLVPGLVFHGILMSSLRLSTKVTPHNTCRFLARSYDLGRAVWPSRCWWRDQSASCRSTTFSAQSVTLALLLYSLNLIQSDSKWFFSLQQEICYFLHTRVGDSRWIFVSSPMIVGDHFLRLLIGYLFAMTQMTYATLE